MQGEQDERAAERLADERARAAGAMRLLGHTFVGRHSPVSLVTEVADTLSDLTARLGEGTVRRRHPSTLGDSADAEFVDGEPVVGFDDRPFSGRSSPWGLDLEMHRRGDQIEAVLTLGAAHEGAPARSHGGIVAALFDDVFGYVLGVLQVPAFTGELTIRYERPTPLHARLICRGRMRERAGRKVWIEGELVDSSGGEEVVVARGVGLFITVARAALEVATASLPAPPDESAVT